MRCGSFYHFALCGAPPPLNYLSITRTFHAVQTYLRIFIRQIKVVDDLGMPPSQQPSKIMDFLPPGRQRAIWNVAEKSVWQCMICGHCTCCRWLNRPTHYGRLHYEVLQPRETARPILMFLVWRDRGSNLGLPHPKGRLHVSVYLVD